MGSKDWYPEVLKLRGRIAELEAKYQWQPFETAPKDKSHFLVCYAYEYVYIQRVYFDGDRLVDVNSGNTSNADYWSHWMPLPEPPEHSNE